MVVSNSRAGPADTIELERCVKAIRIITVVGARPQFVKAAAVSRAIAAHARTSPAVRIDEQIVHTGQHYDPNMSQVFFEELAIPAPAHHLGVGSGPHGEQTGAMIARLEKVLREQEPDLVLLYGDTNSTLAGAIAASKLCLRLAHVEAGLRSFNRRMPEEINRVVADRLSNLLLCPTDASVRNLRAEGITQGVHQVGDVMYDSVLFHAAAAQRESRVLASMALVPREYYLATVHRAENTDDTARRSALFAAFSQLDRPVVVPLHPRTRKLLGSDGAPRGFPNVRLLDPVAYRDMLALEQSARVIVTDSGGVQKEAYFFGVPCVTLREETEWVELVEAGVNELAGSDPQRIVAAVRRMQTVRVEPRASALYGDGRAAEHVVDILAGIHE